MLSWSRFRTQRVVIQVFNKRKKTQKDIPSSSISLLFCLSAMRAVLRGGSVLHIAMEKVPDELLEVSGTAQELTCTVESKNERTLENYVSYFLQ